MNAIDLNTATQPHDIPRILRAAAHQYAEDAEELKTAWQDPQAGRVWNRIARILERAANSVEREIARS